MLEQNLVEIGLNEKEAKVYLAALELGQSVVQDIAIKAGINRATAYFVIEVLMQMGLMSSFHKGKKQFFISADPDRLIEVLEQEKQKITKREENLKKLLPQLQSLNNKQKDRPVVKYYEGKEGINAMMDEYLKLAKGTINMAYSVDSLDKVFSQQEIQKAKEKRVEKALKTKVIYTSDSKTLENTPLSSRIKVPLDKFPIKSDIAVYDNKVRIASFGKRLLGIIIEDKEIAESMRAILDLASEGAKNYENKKRSR